MKSIVSLFSSPENQKKQKSNRRSRSSSASVLDASPALAHARSSSPGILGARSNESNIQPGSATRAHHASRRSMDDARPVFQPRNTEAQTLAQERNTPARKLPNGPTARRRLHAASPSPAKQSEPVDLTLDDSESPLQPPGVPVGFSTSKMRRRDGSVAPLLSAPVSDVAPVPQMLVTKADLFGLPTPSGLLDKTLTLIWRNDCLELLADNESIDVKIPYKAIDAMAWFCNYDVAQSISITVHSASPDLEPLRSRYDPHGEYRKRVNLDFEIGDPGAFTSYRRFCRSIAERHPWIISEHDGQREGMRTRGSRLRPSTRSSSRSGYADDPSSSGELVENLGATDQVVLEYTNIHLTQQDLTKLVPGQFLNDSLIDFYLRYIEREQIPRVMPMPGKGKPTYHIFSSFFFQKLMRKTGNSVTENTTDKLCPNYDVVKRWTRNVDLFNTDFVIVPICDSAHWSLLVICNLRLMHACIEALPEVDETAAAAAQAEVHVQEVEVEVDGDDDRQTDGDIRITLSSDNDHVTDAVMVASTGAGDVLIDNTDTEGRRRRPQRRLDRRPDVVEIDKPDAKASAALEPSFRPYMLWFDSLNMSKAAQTSNMKIIRRYLRNEWFYGKHVEEQRPARPQSLVDRLFSAATLVYSRVSVPQQPNGCDCGLFLLRYCEEFIKAPVERPTVANSVSRDDWFDAEDVAYSMRKEIFELIVSKSDVKEHPFYDGMRQTFAMHETEQDERMKLRKKKAEQDQKRKETARERMNARRRSQDQAKRAKAREAELQRNKQRRLFPPTQLAGQAAIARAESVSAAAQHKLALATIAQKRRRDKPREQHPAQDSVAVVSEDDAELAERVQPATVDSSDESDDLPSNVPPEPRSHTGQRVIESATAVGVVDEALGLVGPPPPATPSSGTFASLTPRKQPRLPLSVSKSRAGGSSSSSGSNRISISNDSKSSKVKKIDDAKQSRIDSFAVGARALPHIPTLRPGVVSERPGPGRIVAPSSDASEDAEGDQDDEDSAESGEDIEDEDVLASVPSRPLVTVAVPGRCDDESDGDGDSPVLGVSAASSASALATVVAAHKPGLTAVSTKQRSVAGNRRGLTGIVPESEDEDHSGGSGSTVFDVDESLTQKQQCRKRSQPEPVLCESDTDIDTGTSSALQAPADDPSRKRRRLQASSELSRNQQRRSSARSVQSLRLSAGRDGASPAAPRRNSRGEDSTLRRSSSDGGAAHRSSAHRRGESGKRRRASHDEDVAGRGNDLSVTRSVVEQFRSGSGIPSPPVPKNRRMSQYSRGHGYEPTSTRRSGLDHQSALFDKLSSRPGNHAR